MVTDGSGLPKTRCGSNNQFHQLLIAGAEVSTFEPLDLFTFSPDIYTMPAMLIFIGIFSCTLSLLTNTHHASSLHHENAITKWKTYYPSVPIPSFIRQAMSPLSDHEIDAVVSMISKNTLTSQFPRFCKTAGLVCDADQLGVSLGGCSLAYCRDNSSNDNSIPRGLFFREATLMNMTQFDMGEISGTSTSTKAFLPNAISSLLPLEQAQIVFNHASPILAKHVNQTIKICSTQAAYEKKTCVSSIDELVEFPAKVFGDTRLNMFTSNSAAGAHQSVVLENIHPLLRENKKSTIISCHEVSFPYELMSCHATSDSQVYQVDLVDPKNKENVINQGVMALCHRNTSYWDPDHVSFRALKTRPGESEICHWLPTANMVWVRLSDTLSGVV